MKSFWKAAGITADRLCGSRATFTSAEMWTGLQADYDLRLCLQKARTIEREVEHWPRCSRPGIK